MSGSILLVGCRDVALSRELGRAYRTVVCPTVTSARWELKQRRPRGALIFAAGSPAMLRLCEDIKFRRATAGAAVVVVTSRDATSRVEALRAGADAVLDTSRDVSRIRRTLDRTIDRIQSRSIARLRRTMTIEFRTLDSFLNDANRACAALLHHTPLAEKEVRQIRSVLTSAGVRVEDWRSSGLAAVAPHAVGFRVVVGFHSNGISLGFEDDGPGFCRHAGVDQCLPTLPDWNGLVRVRG